MLAVLCGMVAASCDRMPLTAPSGTGINLVATTNVLGVNGSTDIIAVLIEGALEGGGEDSPGTIIVGGGTPVHNGTLVTFTTTLGRLEPAEAKTQAGRAQVRLIADGRSGTATITAFSGAAVETLEVSIGAAAAERITVTASPQSLPGVGGSTTISGRVEDAVGNGLGGIPVSFSTTRGTLSAPTSMTNDAGVASTVLTTTQEATVTVSAGGGISADLTGTVVVTLKPRTTVSITPPTSAIVGVPATFTITPAFDAVITNLVVNFGDGQSSPPLGAITGATQVVNVFRSPGVRTVTATVTDGEGTTGTASAQVAVAPLALSLAVSPSSVKPGTLITFTATPSAGALIDRYEWNFGDGGGTELAGNPATRAYPNAGVRVVTVTAIPFGNGTPAIAVATVTVTN